MGYETRMVIGQIGSSTKEDKLKHFIRIASLDLSKCGYESDIYDLGTSVNNRNENKKSKYNEIEAIQVYWSNSFAVDKEKTLKTLIKEDEITTLVNPLVLKEVVEQVSATAESWESEVTKDSYGDKLMAIPLADVLKALKMSNAKELIREEQTYRRFDIAIAMVESLLIAFPPHEVEEDEYNSNLYCVLWGY